MKIKSTYFFLFLCVLISCNSKNNSANENSKNSFSSEQNTDEVEKNYESEISNSECQLEDGNYSATVDYNNPNTGYSETYTLDVEVRDCQVVQINFPKGGYLDESHISYADVDKEGNASVDGEDGKTYEIHIDN